MKAVVKEEHNAAKLTDEGGDGQNNQRGGFSRGGRCYNNAAGAGGSSGITRNDKYPTRNKDLPETLVFDNTGHNNAANFQRTLKGLANFLHMTYSTEVASAVLKIQAVTIPIKDKPKARKDSSGQDLPLTS